MVYVIYLLKHKICCMAWFTWVYCLQQTFFEEETTTVPFNVRNLRKMRNFWQNFLIFFRLPTDMLIFDRILIKVLNILEQNRSFVLWKLNFEAKIGLDFFLTLYILGQIFY